MIERPAFMLMGAMYLNGYILSQQNQGDIEKYQSEKKRNLNQRSLLSWLAGQSNLISSALSQNIW